MSRIGQNGATLLLVVVAVTILSFGGCDSITGCDTRTQTVELVPGDLLFDLRMTALDGFRAAGWDCSNVSDIRDGSGRFIGSRYTCTKCD